LNNLHRQNAGTRDSDHFHEGIGFITQHLKLSRRLEQSLQAIDPWAAAAYWDTSIEMKLVATKQIKHELDTVIWSEEFFGLPCNYSVKSFQFSSPEEWKAASIIGGRWDHAVVPRIDDGTIWGTIAADMVKDGLSVPRNSFGYLRSPWNLNQSPYVTRFMTKEEHPQWATCASLTNSVKSSLYVKKYSLTEFARFWSYQSQFPPHPHAGLHDYIGGAFLRRSVSAIQAVVNKNFPGLTTRKAWENFDFQWFILTQKGLWRSWLVEYPESCEAGASLKECAPVCSTKFRRSVVGEFLMFSLLTVGAPSLPRGGSWWPQKFNIRDYFAGTKSAFLSDEKLQDNLSEIGEVLCNNLGTTIKGENFEASGVLDPTFWLIHPTIDRLFQASAGAFIRKSTKSLTPSALTRAIWPATTHHSCGSLAACITCYHLDTWLSKYIASEGPVCMNPKELLPKAGKFAKSSGKDKSPYVMSHDYLPKERCCFGHGQEDQLFTSFSTSSEEWVVEGPTNSEVLKLLLPNQGPQWDIGGTVVFDHFRYDHCKDKDNRNRLHEALGIK